MNMRHLPFASAKERPGQDKTQSVAPFASVWRNRARMQEVMTVVVQVLAQGDNGLHSEQTRTVKRDHVQRRSAARGKTQYGNKACD